jgi:putative nucleotidyltransferase with HDIG domain
VAALSVGIGRAMALEGADLDRLRLAALLHDIGKLVVPQAILAKPGPLSDAEWRIVRQHPAYARNMLMSVGAHQDVIDAAYSHHERWDGSGYPQRLCGAEIPFAARIVAVADVVNALSSQRAYREAWRHDVVFNHIVDLAGTHLDPSVVDAFVGLRAA